jgi:hypothetical protein
MSVAKGAVPTDPSPDPFPFPLPPLPRLELAISEPVPATATASATAVLMLFPKNIEFGGVVDCVILEFKKVAELVLIKLSHSLLDILR